MLNKDQPLQLFGVVNSAGGGERSDYVRNEFGYHQSSIRRTIVGNDAVGLERS